MLNYEESTGSSGSQDQSIARLVLHNAGQPPQEILLDQAAYTIGRASDNSITLPQPASRHHGRLEQRGNDWYYIDLQSRNGTFLRGRLVEDVKLQDNDVLHIGDAEGNLLRLIFRSPAATEGATIVMPGLSPQTTLLGETSVQQTKVLTIGRDPNSDIHLASPTVSWRHARLETTPQGHRLVDLDSTNGTFVNGQRITAGYTLRPHDNIQIGAFRLTFDGTTIQQYDQRGGLRIDVRNMTLEVGGGRKILNDISLSIEPREFIALVGGSGAGKSTLMKAISGFSRATDGEEAPVLVNGEDYYRNFDAYRAVLGYVPQDDILHRELPVKSALNYAATLRLPSDTTSNEVQDRIDRSLDDVEMKDHLQTRVDKLSGGQRKRVSIASELLAEPSLFFLDEPTSGLDPGLEKKMMYTLRQLADNGRTVVLVTHATENIKQCDHVVFLSRGHMVYFGPPGEALGFFGIEEGSFSDIYNRLDARPDEAIYEHLIEGVLAETYAEWKQYYTGNPGNTNPPPLHELWSIHYQKSEQYRKYVKERQQQFEQTAQQPAAAEPQKKGPRRSPLRQFFILTRRYFDLVVRDRVNLAILLLQSPIIAFFLLLLADPNALRGVTTIEQVIPRVRAEKLLFVLAAVAVWFGIINSAREITKEQSVFRRERLSNLLILPYIGSKLVVLFVLALVQNILLMLILSINVRYPTSQMLLAPPWLEMFVTMMLIAIAGTSIGLLISTFSKNIGPGNQYCPAGAHPADTLCRVDFQNP
jgi:ABC transport system ATP-binding/permease protein